MGGRLFLFLCLMVVCLVPHCWNSIQKETVVDEVEIDARLDKSGVSIEVKQKYHKNVIAKTKLFDSSYINVTINVPVEDDFTNLVKHQVLMYFIIKKIDENYFQLKCTSTVIDEKGDLFFKDTIIDEKFYQHTRKSVGFNHKSKRARLNYPQ